MIECKATSDVNNILAIYYLCCLSCAARDTRCPTRCSDKLSAAHKTNSWTASHSRCSHSGSKSAFLTNWLTGPSHRKQRSAQSQDATRARTVFVGRSSVAAPSSSPTRWTSSRDASWSTANASNSATLSSCREPSNEPEVWFRAKLFFETCSYSPGTYCCFLT